MSISVYVRCIYMNTSKEYIYIYVAKEVQENDAWLKNSSGREESHLIIITKVNITS